MENYAMLLISAVLLAFDFALNKLYQRRAGTSAQAGLCFNAANGLFTGLVFFLIHGLLYGFSFQVTPFSLLLAGAMALFALSYNILGFRMLRDGKMAQYTLFLMIGGMAVPYVWGILALNESVSLLRILGLLLIFGGVYCANFQKGKKLDKKFLLMGGAVFLLNGLVSTVSKMHQIEASAPTVSAPSFVMLSGLAKFIFCGAALLIMKGGKTTLPRPFVKIGPLILCSALIGGVSYLLQLIGAQNLPATVLYPCITGGSIIFTTLAGRLFFREKITRAMGLGILLCFAGVCCFL